MNYKKLIPLLLCGTFAMTGCNHVKNVKQKTKKDLLFSPELVESWYEDQHTSYEWSEESIGTTEGKITAEDLRISTDILCDRGYVQYRKADGKYYLFSLNKGAFLAEAGQDDQIVVNSNTLVGSLVKIGKNVYDGFGDKIIELKNDDFYLTESASYRREKAVGFRFSDGEKLREIKYKPGTGEAPVEKEIDETVGAVFEDERDLKYYGHEDMTLRRDRFDLIVYEKGKIVRTITAPTAQAYNTVIGDRVFYIVNTLLPSDAKEYDFVKRTHNLVAGGGFYSSEKYNQDIYSVDYITGKTYHIESEYYVSSITAPKPDAEGNYTYGVMTAHELRKDKTFDEEAMKCYLVDQNFAIHDDVTQNIFFNGTMGANVSKVDVVKLNGEVHYFFENGTDQQGKLYNSEFKLVRDFANDEGFKMYHFRLSKDRQYLFGDTDDGYGYVGLDGKVVVPFEFDLVYFEPGVEKMYGKINSSYYELTKGEDGKYNKALAGDITDISWDSTKDWIEITRGGVTTFHSLSGKQFASLASTETFANCRVVNLSVVQVRLFYVIYTKGGVEHFRVYKGSAVQK